MRRGGLRLGTVAGIEIELDYSWLVIFALVLWSLAAGYFPARHPGYAAHAYWLVGALAALAFFAAILTHELAHALVANRLGQPVRRITLFLFGGMAHLSQEPRDPASELAVAVAGPLTSLALGGLFWGVQAGLAWSGVDALWVGAAAYLAFINVALAVFNLLPGLPLDGGRILRAVLWWRWGDLRAATASASDWGRGIGLGLILLGALEVFAGALVAGMWLVLIGLFLRGAARSGYYATVLEQTLGRLAVADAMVRDPITIPADRTVAAAIEDFLRHGFAGFPVTRDGNVVGLITLARVTRCPTAERATRTVAELMQPIETAQALAAAAPLGEALRRMEASDEGRLLVVENGRVVGLVTRSGIMRRLRAMLELGLPDDSTPPRERAMAETRPPR